MKTKYLFSGWVRFGFRRWQAVIATPTAEEAWEYLNANTWDHVDGAKCVLSYGERPDQRLKFTGWVRLGFRRWYTVAYGPTEAETLAYLDARSWEARDGAKVALPSGERPDKANA